MAVSSRHHPRLAPAATLLRTALAIGHEAVATIGPRGLACVERLSAIQLPPSLARREPWRHAIGIVAVLAPAGLLALISPALPVTTPGVILLVAVAFAAYLADWAGGLTALILSAVILDVLFVGDRQSMSLPKSDVEAIGFVTTIAAGAGLIWLIERVKTESARQRRAVLAARAAVTVLASLGASSLSPGIGSFSARERSLRTLLNAMVQVNRAHAGALFVVTPDGDALVRAATYGLGSDDADLPEIITLNDGLIGHVAVERRPLFVEDISANARLQGSFLRQTRMRAVLGVPLIDPEDRLLGVAQIGLLVRHRFTPTEIGRMEALAARAAALLQEADVADQREGLLSRAHEAQRRLELVIAAMPEAVVLVAPPDGRIVSYNSAAVALLGSLDEHHPETDLARWLRPSDETGEELMLPHLQALASGEVVAGVELLATRPDGSEVPVLASAAPIREPDGALAAVVVMFRDIGALKEASRIKDEFVSIVSHELRSPLTPIRGFVQLVERDLSREGGHDHHVQWLSSIAGHVDRMTRLVDDLLDVSRLKAGSLDIQPMPTDLVELCRDVVRSRAASSTGHRFDLDAPQPMVVGQWDADRLHQVVDNLVGNAIKYGPAGGAITVSVGVDPQRGIASLTVADEGSGIAPDDRERIFSAFYRTAETERSHIAGLGLGLYICHEIVAAHGGTVSVDDAPGGGAAFTVHLPLHAMSLAA